MFYLDPVSPFNARHFYFLFPLFVILFVLTPFLLFLICCRYRPDKLKASQGQVVIDKILEPLQSHFKRYEPQTLTKEPCIGVIENPESNNELDEKEKEDKKKLYEECPYKVSCRWICFPSCCNGLVYFNFNDFHWVPAGFIILRVILIVIYNYSWDYSIRCMIAAGSSYGHSSAYYSLPSIQERLDKLTRYFHLSRPWIAYCFEQLPVSSN